MAAQRIIIRRDNPDSRQIKEIVRLLRKGEIIIIPTDSIYALACDLNQRGGIDRIYKLLGKKPNKANLSLLCKDLSDISMYTRQISNPVFKLMKRLLPGPYTFILEANSAIPKIFKTNKKTVGIRVPNHAVVEAIINELGNPLVSSSIHSEDEIQEYLTDPDEICDVWQHKVNYIVDAGIGENMGSTVLDCTGQEPTVIREGLGFELLN
jgi:tRNA threonylcarbamoyl adenosine modification protein (Sua5/YciO/YrdC/YwlC family)